MHRSRLDGRGHLDEQQGFIQRDTPLPGRVHQQALFRGLQKGDGGGWGDRAVLVLVMLDGREQTEERPEL